MTKIKLHLGCGTVVVDGWINVDYSRGQDYQKYLLLGILTKN
jgi:hypothetical protein